METVLILDSWGLKPFKHPAHWDDQRNGRRFVKTGDFTSQKEQWNY